MMTRTAPEAGPAIAFTTTEITILDYLIGDSGNRRAKPVIRDDSYRAALAVLVNAHHRSPFSRIWGEGTTSSSDGQLFRGAKRGASRGDINARNGVDIAGRFLGTPHPPARWRV